MRRQGGRKRAGRTEYKLTEQAKASFIVRRSDGEEGKDGEDNFNFNKHCKKERGKWNEKSKVITKILGIFAGFVLVATTLGNDSVTVNAAEVESATEVSGASVSDANEKRQWKRPLAAHQTVMKRQKSRKERRNLKRERRMSRKQPPKIMRKVQKAGQESESAAVTPKRGQKQRRLKQRQLLRLQRK